MFNRATIIFAVIILSSFGVNAAYAASAESYTLEEGTLKLEQVISACNDIAKSKSDKFVNKAIAGKIIEVDGKRYEIRYFSFEDRSGKLPANMTFKEYLTKNNLLNMQSAISKPLPGIVFESFDYRRAKLEDSVYFSMALRQQ